MNKPPCMLIGTLAGGVVGYFIGPYHGGAVLFAVIGLVLGFLVDRGIIKVV